MRPSLFPVAVYVNNISSQEVNMDPNCCLATQFRWNALKRSVSDRGWIQVYSGKQYEENKRFFLTLCMYDALSMSLKMSMIWNL